MASVGGISQPGGVRPTGWGGRQGMPGELSLALVLVHALLAVTVVGGLGVLLTAASYDTFDGQVVALVAYAAAPGVLGWWLARRSWEGGTRVRLGLVAVQGWLIVGGVVNLVSGSARGALQLFLPILIVFFLFRPESRQWYGLAGLERAERRPFSLARLIRWRRDEGQTAVEYAGFIAIVAAIITALLVTGLGTQIFGGIQSEVCKVTGMACGTGTTTTTGTGTGTTGTDKPAPAADKPADQAKGDGKADGKADDNGGCFSGVGAFFGCAGDQVKQVGQGLFVDGVWGDLTGIYDMVRHPIDTVKGIGDYGKQLGDDWSKNSKDAGKKWSDGDYGGALWDWAGASVKTGGTVLYDVFIGDDVAKDWNNGDKTRAVTHVLWNVGSLFIPGYDGAKIVEKVGDLGKIGKLGKLGELAEKAAKAAEDAKKAAKAGDVAGAEKAAKEADEAAEAAERKARQTGCLVGAAGRRIPYGDSGGPPFGGAGTGTTVLAAGSPPYVVLAEGKHCDEDAQKEAEEARKQADGADEAAGRLTKEEVEAARKPTVRQGDPKKFKDHFLRHKKLLEDALGTKYNKLKEDGPRFLQDIEANIKDGTFKLVGKGTLKKGEAEGLIYRGKGVTVVLHENGDFWTVLKSGEGLDTALQITKKAE
jgi:Flp pilus assembly pilin Flp